MKIIGQNIPLVRFFVGTKTSAATILTVSSTCKYAVLKGWFTDPSAAAYLYITSSGNIISGKNGSNLDGFVQLSLAPGAVIGGYSVSATIYYALSLEEYF